MSSAAELDALPPLQLMVLEVLAARYRLGEVLWTFTAHTSTVRAIRALEAAGLVTSMGGVVPRTIRASLTTSGVAAATSPTYRVPDQPQRVQPSREDVAETLMEHQHSGTFNSLEETVYCDCGEHLLVPGGYGSNGYSNDVDGEEKALTAHQADAVLALFAQQPTVSEVKASNSEVEKLILRIENELDHAFFNGHYLADDCQGVAPGERVPAVRVDNIRAALESRA